jgi:WD40 repeat protein
LNTKTTVPIATPIFHQSHQAASKLSLAWSTDGKHLLMALGNVVRVFDIEEAIDRRSGFKPEDSPYKRHTAAVNAVAIAADSLRVATASNDRSVDLWDIESNVLRVHYTAHNAAVLNVSWAPSADRVASSAEDSVHIWPALQTTTPLIVDKAYFLYTEHTGKVNALGWSPNGNLLASGSNDRSLRIWQPTDGHTLDTYFHASSITALAWHKDGRLASVSGSWVQIFHVPDLRM